VGMGVTFTTGVVVVKSWLTGGREYTTYGDSLSLSLLSFLAT